MNENKIQLIGLSQAERGRRLCYDQTFYLHIEKNNAFQVQLRRTEIYKESQNPLLSAHTGFSHTTVSCIIISD